MSQLSFDHLLNLSFAWHTRRKTGEILRVLDRGAAINHTLEVSLIVTFLVVCLLTQILTARSVQYSSDFYRYCHRSGHLLYPFPVDTGLSNFLCHVCIRYSSPYGIAKHCTDDVLVAASVFLTQWRTRLRRQMNERDIVTRGIHTDCLLNYETVKYFGGEEHEGARYAEAIREYQALEYKVISKSLGFTNFLLESLIILSSVSESSESRSKLHNCKYALPWN